VSVSYANPLSFVSGVKTRRLLSMSVAEISSPAVTAAPESVSVPFVGIVLMMTERRLSPSMGSLKPKSALVIVRGVSSSVVSVLSAPLGSSLMGVMSKVKLFGDWSVSMPPSVVPPSSCTAKVKVSAAVPFALWLGWL